MFKQYVPRALANGVADSIKIGGKPSSVRAEEYGYRSLKDQADNPSLDDQHKHGRRSSSMNTSSFAVQNHETEFENEHTDAPKVNGIAMSPEQYQAYKNGQFNK